MESLDIGISSVALEQLNGNMPLLPRTFDVTRLSVDDKGDVDSEIVGCA